MKHGHCAILILTCVNTLCAIFSEDIFFSLNFLNPANSPVAKAARWSVLKVLMVRAENCTKPFNKST